ncbi:NRAMP family divalent metal transporter [Mycobacteroides immunogenum]|uniref:Manganese transporter n=1 Tax=Mycobacteroides immunogenum TaxID=83262 RepID=A0A7V8LTT6_9MYCO|nr:NRAMP family divalent metal transporter [Mycobacteroides immunogenum]AMT73249.1 manganese transporter [Mycobacteroides immunogenum]ANO06409.1 manganese transporter [Mycobacteroides immunogenum]KIU39786.1 manganese transporter [Mycobacteroides immunogenum]KPG10644.1 manganese transporter [Mycobacteroides immunogenum]KPG12781.1 manganese transporter [Mycobacteroides immunogenum]
MAFFNGVSRRYDSGRHAPTGAVMDSAHVGDIVGALGTIGQHESTEGRSRWQRFRMLLAVLGPGLIVMVGDNDAGGVATYAQAGQNYGMALLWTLALLIPVLYVNQEMVVRLGAVAGVGHARLIFSRFGRFWGAFSVGDLFVVNALTIVTEFIGVAMALSYFGLPRWISVPLSAVLLFAVVAGGSFRRWERFLFALIAINIVMIPMAILVHPSLGKTASGFVPSFPGGLNAELLMLIVAIVGTTVAPWQLFFQQSNIVDKRLTPRWIRYERIDLAVGIVVVMIGAVCIMGAAAFGLAGTDAVGNFTDAGAVARLLHEHVSPTVGALFAVLLLDASLIGANAVGLATTYALGDTFGKRHSLHWKLSEAPAFYLGYGALLAVAAAVSFSPDPVLGVLTQGVQALAGVLLPSATVFLVLLCNDKAVLGPWVNSVRQNIVAGVIVWALVLLSLSLTAATFFPDLGTGQLKAFFVGGAAVGLIGGLTVYVAKHRAERAAARATAADLGGLDPDQIQDLDSSPRDRTLRREILWQERETWRTPALDTLERPIWSPLRTAGMIALRGYLVVAVLLVGVKVAQTIIG